MQFPAAIWEPMTIARREQLPYIWRKRVTATGKKRPVSFFLLCRVEFTDEEKHRVSHECKSFNEWRLFTDLALRHGVAALVWQNMCDLDVDRYVTDSDRAMLEG